MVDHASLIVEEGFTIRLPKRPRLLGTAAAIDGCCKNQRESECAPNGDGLKVDVFFS